MLNNNAIIKIDSMMDIGYNDSDDDDDEVFNTKNFSTSLASNYSKSLNDICASKMPLERPNTLAIRTDENLTYNAVSTSGCRQLNHLRVVFAKML